MAPLGFSSWFTVCQAVFRHAANLELIPPFPGAGNRLSAPVTAAVAGPGERGVHREAGARTRAPATGSRGGAAPRPEDRAPAPGPVRPPPPARPTPAAPPGRIGRPDVPRASGTAAHRSPGRPPG